MVSSCQHLPKSTSVLTITIPWSEVKKTYDQVVEKALKEIEVKGFRKGKAPKNVAKQYLNKQEVTKQVLNQIFPPAYTQALQEHKLEPITAPKIEAQEIGENKDWVFKVTVAEKPKIHLGNYREEIKKTKKATPKIWTPKEGDKPSKDQAGKESPLAKTLETLLRVAKVEIPDLLIENETNRLVALTLEEIKKLGLTLNSYLSSVGKTPEILRKEHQKQAEETLKLEFILAEIAEKEKISVEPAEIDEFIQKAPDEKTRKALAGQRYYLASVLRKQKTLDKLLNL